MVSYRGGPEVLGKRWRNDLVDHGGLERGGSGRPGKRVDDRRARRGWQVGATCCHPQLEVQTIAGAREAKEGLVEVDRGGFGVNSERRDAAM